MVSRVGGRSTIVLPGTFIRVGDKMTPLEILLVYVGIPFIVTLTGYTIMEVIIRKREKVIMDRVRSRGYIEVTIHGDGTVESRRVPGKE